MRKKASAYISLLSQQLLIYGSFTVICHAAFSFVYCKSYCEDSLLRFQNIYPEFLEHSVMSFVLVLVGSLLIDMALKHQKKS